jgi:hypothetical protein
MFGFPVEPSPSITLPAPQPIKTARQEDRRLLLWCPEQGGWRRQGNFSPHSASLPMGHGSTGLRARSSAANALDAAAYFETAPHRR